MANYSSSDKFLHKFYLSNYSISNASLEIEQILYGKKANEWRVEQSVFITGLARSGTTAVMRKLHETGEYASLQYNNMPFLLAPNLWNRKVNIETHERAHKDGIQVDGNSPEEFDEYFWKVVLKDGYITENNLIIHDIDESTLEKYVKYIHLICYSKRKHRYISKNNNNILRLKSLTKLSNSKIIMLFRNPIDHAASLQKLHFKFVEMQSEDSFILNYFDYLGHHEFGWHHKPFDLGENIIDVVSVYSKDSINFWLSIWLNYYGYVLAKVVSYVHLISFETLTNQPNKVYRTLWDQLNIVGNYMTTEQHRPNTYKHFNCEQQLLQKCNLVYEKLLSLTIDNN